MICMSVERNTTMKNTVEERQKRVSWLKKAIVVAFLICLLLPSVICISLWVKVVKLEKNVDKLEETRAKQYKVSENEEEHVIFAAETKENTKKDGKKNTSEKSKDTQEKGKTENKRPDDRDYDQTKIKGKKVYLTFDDGPSANTQKVLEILKENDIKATFFVVGRTDDTSKGLYKSIYDQGHTLAMHSYTHDYQKIYKSVGAYQKDLMELSDLLYGVTGERPRYMRFPGGSSNTVSSVDMKSIIKYVKNEKLQYYDWNVINGDATGKNLPESKMVNSVVSGVKKYDTSIVLMHDCAGKEKTVKTLPKILNKLKKMKVTFLPINDTTVPVQHIKADDVK